MQPMREEKRLGYLIKRDRAFLLQWCLMFHRWHEYLAKMRLSEIEPFLGPGEKILDIGAGNCLVAESLKKRSFSVTALDITNRSCSSEISPILYDGANIPFDDRSFDVALLLTVLHHVPNPQALLAEAARVAGKIIIIEDIYSSSWQKYATFTMDSLVNFEFFGHPHSNLDDAGWQQLFSELGLFVKESRYHSFWLLFQSATYVIGPSSIPLH